jgi:hypothetical protein
MPNSQRSAPSQFHNDGTGSPQRVIDFSEKKYSRNSREQKDFVIQVMDMRSAKMQKRSGTRRIIMGITSVRDAMKVTKNATKTRRAR